MVKITRQVDSTNLFIEMVDVVIRHDMMDMAGTINQAIIKFLSEEYVREHKAEIFVKIQESEIVNGLATMIAKTLIRGIKEQAEEETNG